MDLSDVNTSPNWGDDIKKVLANSAVLLLFLFVWSGLFSPIFITLSAAETTPYLSTAWRDVPLVLSRTSAVAESQKKTSPDNVRITRISNGKVELALPIASGERLKREQLPVVQGCWNSTYGGERIETCDDVGVASIAVPASNITELPFLSKPDGGTVLIQQGATSRTRVLRTENYGWAPEALPLLGSTTSVATISALEALLTPRLPRGDASAKWEWRFGYESATEAVSLRGSEALVFDQMLIISHIFSGIMRFIFIISGGVILLFLGWILGISIAGVAPQGNILTLSNFLTRSAIGISISCLVVNSISYFYALNSLRLLLIVALIAFLVLGLFRAGRNMRLPIARVDRMPFYASLTGASLIFWPLLFTPASAFLGFLQTDSFYYTNVSSLIQNNALLKLITQGSYIGHGMRSIDLSATAALQTVSMFSPGTCWVMVSTMCALMMPICAYGVSRTIGTQRCARLSCWAIALSAAISGIFFESYLAQFLLTGILFYTIYVAVQMIETPESDQWLTFAFAACCAVAILLYPYFAIPVPIMAAAILLSRYRQAGTAAALRLSAIGIALTLLLGNVGYYFLAASGVTEQFTPALNNIAINIVFPFMWKAKFSQFLIGVAPFHGNEDIYRAILESAPSLFFIAIAKINSLPYIYGARALLFACVIAAYIWSLIASATAIKNNLSLLVLNLIPFAFAAVSVLAYFGSGPYAYAKVLWTGATLFPLVFSINISTAISTRQPKLLLRRLALLIFMAWLGANALSKLSEAGYWTANSTASLDNISNISVADEIGSSQSVLNAIDIPLNGEVTMVSGYAAAPPQKLLVLAAHTASLIESAGARCINCERSIQLGDGRWFRPATSSEILDSDALIIIGPQPAGCTTTVNSLMDDQITILKRTQAGYPPACIGTSSD